MVQVINILPPRRWEAAYPTESIPLLMMTWRCKEPGHQQLWYWPCLIIIFWFQHQKGQRTTNIIIEHILDGIIPQKQMFWVHQHTKTFSSGIMVPPTMFISLLFVPEIYTTWNNPWPCYLVRYHAEFSCEELMMIDGADALPPINLHTL